jgi:DNA-binding MltR family transcriptional regulator
MMADENNTVLVRVARAMYGQQVDHVRQHAAELDLKPERLRRVFLAARTEADRSVAILMFALAEDLMLDAIKRYLNGDVKGGWDEVTSANGLLANANDRITLLHLLSWIHPAVYADLRLLKSIRNRFAHHADVSNFEDGKIRSWISAISLTEAAALAAAIEAGVPRPTKFSARQLFPYALFSGDNTARHKPCDCTRS